jgi:transaldolase
MNKENVRPKTKIFLDSGDPKETRKVLALGFPLDGQTTNPSLIANNPEVMSKLKEKGRFSEEGIRDFYKGTIKEISGLIPQGSVSVEVYVDSDTTSLQILKEAREMSSWIPNAHVKIPITKEGLLAAHQAVQEGINVNMTLCFTEEQAAAVSLATKDASKKGDVFISPFIGRLDDIGKDGLSLVFNILKSHKNYEGNKVEVLAASVRNMSQFMACLKGECDIITAPFKVLAEWVEKGCPIPDNNFNYKSGFKEIPYEGVLEKTLVSSQAWKEMNLKNELTTKGLEKFVADWKSLISS